MSHHVISRSKRDLRHELGDLPLKSAISIIKAKFRFTVSR